ncbi:MAG: anti-sigma factor family protein [Flavitalea sp.]
MMNIINRQNYEEYFLLYTDDELDPAERIAVEEFVQQHPDLKIELDMLQRSVLPAQPIVFHGKDALLRNSSSIVNETNYEEYFVLYADDELDNELKDGVEQFVSRNPKYQSEFELIQKVRFTADNEVVFPDKTSLYRTEKDDEVIVFRWRNIAAAAIVFFFLGGLAWYFNVKENSSTPVVQTTPQKSKELEVPKKASPENNNIAKKDPAFTEPVITEIKKAEFRERRLARKGTGKMEKSTPDLLMVSKNVDKDIEGRNIQVATTVTLERPDINLPEMKASNAALQPRKEIIDEAVGEIQENPYAFEASNDEIAILNTTISKKNRLRGILRKVSRVVEKTTSLDPGDVRGVRIANFEIGLK